MAERMLKLCRRSQWAHWFCGARTPVSNPGYTILSESKRFPRVLKELDAPMPAYRSHSPESRFPTEISPSSQNQWVFKPAFGVAGRGVAIAGVTRKLAFDGAAEVSRRHPMNWVAQRRFESVAVPTERGPGFVCLGIYTVDGSAAGAYARIKGKALIDNRALSIPVLIPERDLAVPVAYRRR
jgi:glutathionylspermidine synthase